MREYYHKGYLWQSRLWVDDMFMITALGERYDLYRNRIKAGYMCMMESLLKYQSFDGMWGQLVDNMSLK